MARLNRGVAWLLALLVMSPAAAAPPPQTVTVVTTEYRFSPNRLTFRSGVAYRLHVANRGKETHEFTAPEFFRTVRLADTAALNADRTEIVVQPGQAKDLNFVAGKPGRYDLRCSDHDWAGMTGEIVVK